MFPPAKCTCRDASLEPHRHLHFKEPPCAGFEHRTQMKLIAPSARHRRNQFAALCAVVILSGSFSVAADTLPSKTAYSKAYGATKGSVEVDPAKDLPRYPAVEPKDAIATWKIKPGFRLKLAAQEPQVCAVRTPFRSMNAGACLSSRPMCRTPNAERVLKPGMLWPPGAAAIHRRRSTCVRR